jgi:ABC-type phosphonate transport system ATPase subunit
MCSACSGNRLRTEARQVKITGKDICQVCSMTVEAAANFFSTLKLTRKEEDIGGKLLEEIRERLKFLNDVGLEYLTLDRLASTLSGGEAQRIQLATSLGSRLAITRRAERVRKALEHTESAELRELVAQFEHRLETFRARLATEQIAAADLFIDTGATLGARFVIREGFLAAILLPVSWWGRITHWIPIRITRWLALRHRTIPSKLCVTLAQTFCNR